MFPLDGPVVLRESEEGTALAGHLHSARVSTWFVNAYVEPLTDSWNDR